MEKVADVVYLGQLRAVFPLVLGPLSVFRAATWAKAWGHRLHVALAGWKRHGGV